MDPGHTEKAVIYIVDDEVSNLYIMQATLKSEGHTIRCFSGGTELLGALDGGLEAPDLFLVDVMMPNVSGLDVLAYVRSKPNLQRLPVVLVTGVDGVNNRVKGLDSGADDYVAKPFHPAEIRARVRSLLRIKWLGDALERSNALLADQNVHLEERVQARTRELEDITMGVVTSLEKANQLNDADTGAHIYRVSAYSELLAKSVGLPPEVIIKIRRYSSLHDVGKVGTPDNVLKKPGPLDELEYDRMKHHTFMGYELLLLARSDPIALNIALCHHERWDGDGYPLGLSGTAIPLEARIVAVADVFDALSTRRVYKSAYPLDVARQVLLQQRGQHLDPLLVDSFLANWDDVERIYQEYADSAEEAARRSASGEYRTITPLSTLAQWEYENVARPEPPQTPGGRKGATASQKWATTTDGFSTVFMRKEEEKNH
jgi:putative two-component system response regulator